MTRVLRVHPLPRNMHPERNTGRRRARVRYLNRTLSEVEEDRVHYTDAACMTNGHTAVVVSGTHEIVSAASISSPCSATESGEILAVTLAIQHTLSLPAETYYIITDSQAACRAFLTGRGIPKTSYSILLRTSTAASDISHTIHLLWTPGHARLSGNERAHTAARELTLRAAPRSEAANTEL